MARKQISPWLILILLGAWALLTIRMGSEWFGHQDANGAWISVAVRNYQLHGFFQLGGIIDTNTALNGGLQAYTHHPPLTVWLSAIPVLLAGYDETLIRWVAASCTLVGAAALYVLARRLKGQRFALWSVAFYLFTPMMAYFGRMPDHEAPALMFALLFAAVLVDWPRSPTRARWWALLVLALLTTWTAWGGLIMIAVLGAGVMLVSRRRVPLVMIGVVVTASIIVMYGYYLIFFPEALSDLITAFVWRSSANSLDPGSVSFTAVQYLVRVLTRLITLYTPSVTVLAFIGVALLVRMRGLLRLMLVALLAAGFGYTLVFRNAAYIHDYYLLYAAPGLALLAGAAVALLPRRVPRWLRPFVAALVIVALPSSLYFLGEIYSSADPTLGLEFARALHDHTAPDDVILSSLPTIGYALEFYAERAVQWSIQPADALETALHADNPVYYLYCENDSTLPPGTPELSRFEIVPGCALARLH